MADRNVVVSPASKSIVDQAIGALGVWVTAMTSSAELDQESACDLQVAAAAIDESLEPASEELIGGHDCLHGRLLVRMLDSALWNYATGEANALPPRAALVATARMAINRLNAASAALAVHAGGAR